MSERRIRTRGNRHLRRRAGCVGFWVMITHRNARHVRRPLAECCNFLPGWWRLPKTAGLQTGSKGTKPDSWTENSPDGLFSLRSHSFTHKGEGGQLTRSRQSTTTPPPLPDFNYLPGGMWRIPQEGGCTSRVQSRQLCRRYFPCIAFPGLAGFTWIFLPPPPSVCSQRCLV